MRVHFYFCVFFVVLFSVVDKDQLLRLVSQRLLSEGGQEFKQQLGNLLYENVGTLEEEESIIEP